LTKVFLTYGALISPLGNNEEEHFSAFKENKTAVRLIEGAGFDGKSWCLSAFDRNNKLTYDALLLQTINQALTKCPIDLKKIKKIAVVLSTTKANLLPDVSSAFDSSRRIIGSSFPVATELTIVSNACISGVIAINTAANDIRSGNVDAVCVIGIDVLWDFVVYGFQSLFALSDEVCRPYDAQRKGINIGEAAGALWLTKEESSGFSVEYLGGASSNDANHISGPSRTGEGLFRAINRALKRSNISPKEIDFISAHGTATLYNDNMESIAFERLGLSNIPINSMKGYFGHTLGAAGVIEVVISMLSMQHGMLFKSLGYEINGTDAHMNLLTENQNFAVNTILKTASGFGGGNAALILKSRS